MDYVPDADELTKALDHVFYEAHQLTLMGGGESTDVALNNAMLESCLLHVRNLLDFFEHRATPKDDVLSAHYGFPASPIPVDKLSREKLNKDLAHLTYSRTRRSVADKGWHHGQAVLPVLCRCLSFTEHVPKNRTIYAARTKEDWQTLLRLLSKVVKVASPAGPA